MEKEFSIEKFKKDQHLLVSTLLQLEKDFSQAGIELNIDKSGEISFDALAEKLKPEIEKLMNKNYEAFLNLLYRIDLNETRIKRETENNKNKSHELMLAEMIIKRELQKVVIREFYKNKDDEN